MPPLLNIALFLFLQNIPPQQCALSGTVVDSATGDPMSHVEIRLEPLDRQATHIAVTTSDDRGHFTLVDLDPGSYHLKAKRSGYLEMALGSRRPNREGTVVRLEPGQTLQGFDFKLMRSAVIAGIVRTSSGEPLEGAHVTLARCTYAFGSPRLEGIESMDTDDRGEYRFRGLWPGKYYVGVEGERPGWDQVDHSAKRRPVEISMPTLYPGVSDAAQAAPIEISAGSSVTGVDIRQLRSRGSRISGRVVNAPSTGRLTITLHDPKSEGIRDYDIRTSTRNGFGEFEFRNVPPGIYDLTTGTESLRGRISVDVSASDLDNVRLVLAPGATIQLHVLAEGRKIMDLSGLKLFLTANSRNGFGSPQVESGVPTVQNVPPDHYAVTFYGSLLRQSYVKAARTRDADVLADGLTVTGPGTIDIDVTVASDIGQLEGDVLDEDLRPVPGATILLAPEQRARTDRFLSTTSDQNGHYEFTALAPGNYKLFVWEDSEPEAWKDSDFLRHYESQGKSVEIKSFARATAALRPMSGDAQVIHQ